MLRSVSGLRRRKGQVSAGEADSDAEHALELAVLLVASSAEEGVAKHDVAHVTRAGVIEHVGVDEEEDGQIHLLAGQQALLLEAEALDLGEVRRDLPEPC